MFKDGETQFFSVYCPSMFIEEMRSLPDVVCVGPDSDYYEEENRQIKKEESFNNKFKNLILTKIFQKKA